MLFIILRFFKPIYFEQEEMSDSASCISSLKTLISFSEKPYVSKFNSFALGITDFKLLRNGLDILFPHLAYLVAIVMLNIILSISGNLLL